MITIQFVCGHEKIVDGAMPPVCLCGETKIARVTAPPPQFVGHVTGPHATFKELEPQAVVFEEKT